MVEYLQAHSMMRVSRAVVESLTNDSVKYLESFYEQQIQDLRFRFLLLMLMLMGFSLRTL